jgi:soluble lytic murein transglycosylase
MIRRAPREKFGYTRAGLAFYRKTFAGQVRTVRFPLQVLVRSALLLMLCAAPGVRADDSEADTGIEATEPPVAAGRTIDAETSEARLLQQRPLFMQTRDLLRKGNVAAAAEGMAALIDYPLYPYLELQRLNIGLDQRDVTPDEPGADDGTNAAGAEAGSAIATTTAGAPSDTAAIDAFLRRYAGSLVAEQLRKSWLAILANDRRWTEYLRYYADATPTKQQQCWNLEALYQTGNIAAALQQTGALWLEADLPADCDEPFKRWLGSDQRSEPLVWQRLLLSLEGKQETHARFLAVNIREPYRLSAEYALLLYKDPAALGNLLPQLTGRAEAGAVAALTLKNLAKQDPDTATALWQQLRNDGQLSTEQSNAVRAAIGRQQIAQRGVDALSWLLMHDATGEDSTLLESRVRLALPGGDWSRIAQWIEQMPPALAQTPRWSYWRARALATQQADPQQHQHATALFQELAKDRSYYGFRAADHLRTPYQLNDRPLAGRAVRQRPQSPALLRAREFYALGEAANGRREWLSALRDMTTEQQQNTALLAEQWGWHDRAIQTASKAGAWDDLQLRFPLAYKDVMQQAALEKALPLSWLFAIARQESTFMPDARSSVGALGLMQLMPATAREVARGLRIKTSPADLQRPGPNVQLGSTYLSAMLKRYSGNRILATAAYNAGPGRISRLVKNQQGTLPSDIWIETLPYRETREYVQNVLAFNVIYARRLGGNKPLVEANEANVTGLAP